MHTAFLDAYLYKFFIIVYNKMQNEASERNCVTGSHAEDPDMDKEQLFISEMMKEEGGIFAGMGSTFRLTAADFDGKNHSDVLEAALAAHDSVYLPLLPFVVLLDRPIVMESGKRLSVHPETVITLKENHGGCMLRNKNILDGREKEVGPDDPDHDIAVEGGIWAYGKTGKSVGDPDPLMQEISPSCLLGVFFFDNCEKFTVANVTIRQSLFDGFLITNCRHFVIENVFFDDHKKDGIHVNGPASYGRIRNIRGKAGDDILALNAWDWRGSAVTFGAIHHIYAENFDCEGDECRLLPGRKIFRDGKTVDCPIYDCVFRRFSNVYAFKLYQQPNCHTPKEDHSAIPGNIDGVTFDDIYLGALTAEGFGEIGVTSLFDICADCYFLTFRNIAVGVSREEFEKAGLVLTDIGAKSSTWKRGSDDPSTWTELFDPDMTCKVDKLRYENVTFAGEKCTDEPVLVHTHRLKPNPDYPNTTPKGGTGFGVHGAINIY